MYQKKIVYDSRKWKDQIDAKIRSEKSARYETLKERLRIQKMSLLGFYHGIVDKKILATQKSDLEEMQSLEKDLVSSVVFTDQGITYMGHMPSDPEFSIAEYCGRFMIDKNRAGFSVDKYHDVHCAEIVAEGGETTGVSLLDFMRRIMTESDDSLIFDDVLRVGLPIYNDDQTATTAAINSSHHKHIINAENKAIFSKMIASKDPVEVSPESIQTTINSALCGKAKRGAEIWTNKTGFSALDIDVDGIPLIKRNGNGDFIYKDKYIVREFPVEILPNKSIGVPVLIGDFKNLIRFAVIDSRSLSTDIADFELMGIADRNLIKEIPILTTTEDAAFVNGYISMYTGVVDEDPENEPQEEPEDETEETSEEMTEGNNETQEENSENNENEPQGDTISEDTSIES